MKKMIPQPQFYISFIALNPIPLLLLNHQVSIILTPAFIFLYKILTIRIIFEFYFRYFFFIKQKLLETMKK